MCRCSLPRLHIQTGLSLLPAIFFSIVSEDKIERPQEPKTNNKKLKLSPLSHQLLSIYMSLYLQFPSLAYP